MPKLIIMKRTGPTNTRTRDLIVQLDKYGKSSKQDVYRLLSNMMGMSTRERTQVSVSHVNKMNETYKDKVLVVPGKVLSNGEITSPAHVAAFAFSQAAKQKIEAAKGKAWTLEDLVKHNVPANKMILVK